jgi:hypothetical protein
MSAAKQRSLAACLYQKEGTPASFGLKTRPSRPFSAWLPQAAHRPRLRPLVSDEQPIPVLLDHLGVAVDALYLVAADRVLIAGGGPFFL